MNGGKATRVEAGEIGVRCRRQLDLGDGRAAAEPSGSRGERRGMDGGLL